MGGAAMHATPPCGGVYQTGLEKSTSGGPPGPSVRKHTGDVTHLAAGAYGGLAVEVDGGTGNLQPALEILNLAADEIDHLHTAAADRFGQRPARYRPDMLLELRHRSSVQRPMAGIVHPRRDLVDQELHSVALHKHLHRQYAHIVERLCDRARDPPSLLRGHVRQSGRHTRDFQNVIAVLVLGHIKTFNPAVPATRRDDRNLALERHEGFQDAGLAADVAPRGLRIAAIADRDLAFAVVAEAARFQHR